MQPRLAAGNQATESVELIRNGTAGDSSAALVDQLVLEFLCMELNEPPAAQLAKMAGDRAQLQFISSMFDRNPILEQLAASAVPNQHGNRYESTVPVERTQQLRLLYLIREVLKRRNILSQNVTTQAKQHWSIQTPTTHTVLQQEMKSTSVSEYCEYCGSKKQSTYRTNLTQNVPIAQSPKVLITQHESELVTAPSKVGTTPVAGQQRQVVRTSKITEKTTESHVTMSVKIYIPSPPPCRSLIEKAKTRISEMFTPEFDALKREQLIHLAMLNGTYRKTMPSLRPT